jgi:hypothetical protein
MLASLVVSLAWIGLTPAFAGAQLTPAIIEAAKKEGEVMFYGAITIKSSKAVGDLFEKKYGIKLNVPVAAMSRMRK